MFILDKSNALLLFNGCAPPKSKSKMQTNTQAAGVYIR